MAKNNPTQEQLDILNNSSKSLIVSASAGSGKTWVLVEYITKLVCQKKVPLKRLLVLTFTNVAAAEMKERLLKALQSQAPTKFNLEQIDELPTADICTIDSFCEKVIKRNLEKSSLDESFTILDESEALKLKNQAFSDACEKFMQENFENFLYLYSSFKKNKKSIFDCLVSIGSYLDSLSRPQELIEKIIAQQSAFFDKACKALLNKYKQDFDEIVGKLKLLKSSDIHPKYIEVVDKLLNLCESFVFDDFIKLSNSVKAIESLPAMPVLKVQDRDEFVAKKLSSAKESLKDMIDALSAYNFQDEELLEATKSGKLATSIISLYCLYKEAYQQLKSEQDRLDFADIEHICAELLKDEEVVKKLQEDYDYTFIDEYQDTNFLQEEIIKKVASAGNFVGVGDPKQAIYGFRNATMEIMNRDIEENISNPDGNVVFLRGNFRSDKRVLDFVNSIFAPLMKKDNTGIDYLSTSMLDGKAGYEEDVGKAVEICFVHSDDKKQEEEKSGVYSVKNASLYAGEKDEEEARAICAYIDELLTQKIYDLKLEKWRKVEPSDIVVLMRGRGSLMQTLTSTLERNGYPVLADDKTELCDDSEIQVLLNLLKYCLDENDQIAFISLLLSKFGGMAVQEVAVFASKLLSTQKLFEELKSSQNPKVLSLQENIEKFKKEVYVFGLRRAYELLFDRCDYFAYLKFLGEEKVQKVEKFLNVISQSGYYSEIASFLEYISKLSSGKVQGEGASSNAINIMVTHGSKGMEFPIVILAGCGKSVFSAIKTPYVITQEYGLACMEYNLDKLLKTRTPQFEATKLYKKEREYIDELMIFYVALTRAKNKLILTGEYDPRDFEIEDKDFFKGKCYFDWLLMSLSESDRQKAKSQDEFENDLAHFVNVDKVEELKTLQRENLVTEEDKNLTKKVQEYFDFVYPNIELSKVEFKNSVTGLLKLQIDDKLEEEQVDMNFVKTNNGEFSASEVGTIYHEVLKDLNFEEINTLQDVENRLQDLVELGYLTRQEKEVVDAQIIFKDILILKKLTKNKKIFKEKPFIMKIKLNEIIDTKHEDSVLVQGVVDMFALGDENILVDYKYTSILNKEKLIKKYSKQLSLYSKAIEKAFNLKLNKKYIFSIKNNELIEFFD